MLTQEFTTQRSATSEAEVYLSRVVPWVDGAYINLHWTGTKLNPHNGKPYWQGRAHKTIEEAANTLKWITGKADTRDIYACMSAQEQCEKKVTAGGNFSYRKATKGTQTAVALKSLFVDVDVKEGAYPSTQEAIFGLRDFLKASGLPHPTISVASGSGGAHFYWCMSRALSREEWTPLAHALVEATRRHGLNCDSQCTIDAARVLRVPGTLNWKSDPPRPVTLGVRSVLPGDYPVEELQAALAPYMGAQVINFAQATAGIGSREMATPGLNDEFTAGIAEAIKWPPVDLDSVADTCGFVREALSTGGSAFSNPLWNLTTLLATFGMGKDGNDGRAQAHRMAVGHSDYSQPSTDELYNRKLREKEERNIGWPSCATIQGAGCTSCASCPMLQFGKSPLHFGREQHGAPVASLATTPRKILKAAGLTDLPMIPERREPLLGSMLVRSSVSVLTAPGGVGKTSLIVAAALSVCSGQDLLGMPVYCVKALGGLRTLFINAEDSTQEINRRIRASMLHYALGEEELGGLRIIGAESFGLSLLTPGKVGSTINEEHWAALERLINEERPDVFILDPLYSVMGGASVNDNAAMGLFIGRLTALAAGQNLSVLLAHHTGKGKDLSSQDASLGAVSIVNGARVVVNLERLTIESARKLSVPSWIAPSCFRLRFVKANLRAANDEAGLFRTVGVQINNAKPPIYPEGDCIGVVEVYRPEAAGPAFPPGMVRDALHAIGGAQPPLNPTPQARKHRACPAVAQAIAHHRGGQTDEIGAASLLAYLDFAGLVVSAEFTEQGQKGRSSKRKGLMVTDAGNSLLQSCVRQQDCGGATAGWAEHAHFPKSQSFPVSPQD
ncbi:AAA family ATPase [Methylorubrum extorquens]